MILKGFVPTGTTFEPKDKYTVVVRSPQPWVTVFDYFQVLNIIEKATAESAESTTKVVGTGPFMFTEWVQGQHLRFDKHKNYWRSGRPYLDAVTMNIRQDPQAMITELEAGALDAVLAPSWRDFARLKTNPKFQALKVSPPAAFHQFQPNVTSKPFDDKRVRQAINWSIDRKRIVDSVMLGESTTQSLPWLPNSPAFEASKQNHYLLDLDKAKALLAQASVSGLNMDYVYSPLTPEYGQMGEILQSDLAKVGVTLNLKSVQYAPLLDTIQKQTYNGLYTLNDSWSSMEPTVLFTSSASMQAVKNNGGFKDAQYSDMVNKVSTEPDAAKRKAMYSAINDFLLDQSFQMPVTQNPARMLLAANVRGMASRQLDLFFMTDTWLA
jgi:peptide/nickel transport system substrate-binding protein